MQIYTERQDAPIYFKTYNRGTCRVSMATGSKRARFDLVACAGNVVGYKIIYNKPGIKNGRHETNMTMNIIFLRMIKEKYKYNKQYQIRILKQKIRNKTE